MVKTLSPRALALVIKHEVGGGKPYYDRFLARPTWPEGASGVTIGVGYDLGYTPLERFRGDWAGLEDVTRDRLAAVIGYKGQAAANRVGRLKDIKIPWEIAFCVFQARTVPYFIGQTLQAFPGADALPADAFGALVSLVFNRGPALKGKNRQDMDDIFRILADGVQAGDQAAIALQLREMKVIWKGRGLDGLLERREDEACMIESAR